jgi:hypothetical protein
LGGRIPFANGSFYDGPFANQRDLETNALYYDEVNAPFHYNRYTQAGPEVDYSGAKSMYTNEIGPEDILNYDPILMQAYLNRNKRTSPSTEEGINQIPSNFNEQYNKGTGWLTDARTADEMAQLPIDPLKNKRQKLTDFLSRFIPGATVSKMLRPDANEAYGNVAGLYPEEVWGMQEFGTGEDLRTDPWGKNIVSHAGDYEEGIKDWWEKYGKMEYQTPRMKQKQAWKKRALDKIIKQEQVREATKRATVQQMSERNRIENTGGWQSGMAADQGFMTGPAQGEQLSDVMGSFNRGGLAGLWRR